MATLHGNWLPDLQRFFLWGETWRKAEAVDLLDLKADAPPALANQPYQLSQSALADVFHPIDPDLHLTWMQALVSPAASKSSGRAGGKTTAAKKKSRSNSWQSRAVVLPTQREESGLLPALSAEAQDAVELYPWQVSGAVLEATTTVKFLSALPLGHSG